MAREDFKNEGDDYDPDVIYDGPSRDEKGFSVYIRVTVPTDWWAMVHSITDNFEAFPEYKRSAQAFVRDALWHRTKWAAAQTHRGNLSKVQQYAALLDTEARLDTKDRMRAAAKRLEKQIDTTLQEAIYDMDREGARTLISEARNNVRKMEEPYRSRLMDKLDGWQKRAEM